MRDAAEVCSREVPGSQHAVRVTVGTVRSSAIGIQAPRAEVANFAPGRSTTDLAFFCYRFVARAHADEWWATTGDHETTLHIAGIGDANHDYGVFDGSGFD